MPPASIAIHAGSLPGVVTVDESAYRLSEERVDAYLHRLGLSRADVASAPSLGALTALQTAHVDRIAYETIGVHTGEPPPPLDPRSSVERVVVHERGGYCFLLVDAYAALLVSLGFSVSLHCGGVGPYPLPLERWGNHVVLLVHGLGDGPLVSDVGLGDGPAAPFALRTHEWSEGGYTYALREEAARADEWRFVHDSGASFEGFSFRVDTSCTGAREFGRYQ
jgi:N-hydroxyarylamine O-acetyltransferase